MPGRIVLATFLLALLVVPAVAEQRCGWLQNPTPGNWTLSDADGDWLLSSQGTGRQAEGMDIIPDITVRDFVVTNPPDHGYACACLSVELDAQGTHIDRITGFKQLPLRKCDADANLSRPE